MNERRGLTALNLAIPIYSFVHGSYACRKPVKHCIGLCVYISPSSGDIRCSAGNRICGLRCRSQFITCRYFGLYRDSTRDAANPEQVLWIWRYEKCKADFKICNKINAVYIWRIEKCLGK